MRIAFLHPTHPDNEGTGATYSATRTIEALYKRGHDIIVFAPESGNSDKFEFPIEELNVKSSFPHHFDIDLNKSIKSRCEEIKNYDVFHSYLMRAIPSVVSISEKTNVSTYVTLNAYLGVCPKNDLLYKDREKCEKNGMVRCFQCLTSTNIKDDATSGFDSIYSIYHKIRRANILQEADIKKIDGFRAPSQHVKSNYLKFGYPEGKIKVIPHIVKDNFIIDHQSDFTPPYNLLYVGALEKHKGVQRLIPIIERLNRKSNKDINLTIVGEGSLKEKLKNIASQSKYSSKICFKGFIPNDQCPSIYSNHDLFIYPGIWEEPLARVFIESIATKTPIVSSEFGSIKSIIGDSGRIVSHNTVDGFVDEISGLLNQQTLQSMSTSCSQELSKFREKNIIGDIEHMYESE